MKKQKSFSMIVRKSYTYTEIRYPERAHTFDIEAFLDHNLTEEDPDGSSLLYAFIDDRDSSIRIPVYYTQRLIRNLNYNKEEYKLKKSKRHISKTKHLAPHIRIKSSYTPYDYQIPHIEFLSNPHTNHKLLDLQTGKGKTFCALNAICNLNRRTLIIVPPTLLELWYKSIKDILVIREDKDIYVIKGKQSIINLESFNTDDDSNIPSIFLASNNTLSSYINNLNKYPPTFPPCLKLFKRFRFGTKVIDEIHLNFLRNLLIDLNTSIPHNLYLSATPGRSSYRSNFIFNNVYPLEIRSNLSIDDKYIIDYEVFYELRGRLPVRYFNIRNRGYSQIRFEKYILKRDFLYKQLVYNVILPLIKIFYLNDTKARKNKLLIFVALQKTAHLLKDMYSSMDEFKGVKITTFLGGDPDSYLRENDIIISTLGSMGTGKDVKGIARIISLVSIRSPILLKQMVGRMRKHETDQIVFHLVNQIVPSHLNHYRQRLGTYRNVVKDIKVKSLTGIITDGG